MQPKIAPPKSHRPETIGQANAWDAIKRRYLAAGFCHRCAARAAWGHQIGFTKTDPPCEHCAGLTVPEIAGERAARWSGQPTDQTNPTVHPPSIARNDLAGTCSCGARWTGTATAHCSACHSSFSGVSLFDQHRKAAGEHGGCTHPEVLAETTPLIQVDGVWRYPEMTEEQKLARFGAAS